MSKLTADMVLAKIRQLPSLPAVVLDAAPPVIDASAHFKTWEDRVRAEAESVQAARRVREPLFKRLLRAFLDR